MTDLTWRQDACGWWADVPLEFAGARTASVLAHENRRELPSGINGLHLSAGDHVAVIVLDDTPGPLDLLVDYVVAGLRDGRRPEHLSFELTEGSTSDDVRARIERRLQGPVPRALDIIDWSRNSGDYDSEYFTRKGMHRAIDQEAQRFTGERDALLRVASEDCSKFMSWLVNPGEYLMYEYELAGDLRARLDGHDFLQLCTFRINTLTETMGREGMSIQRALAHVLASHSKWVIVDGAEVLPGRAGLARIATHLSASAKEEATRLLLMRAAVRTFRWLAKLRRTGGRSSGRSDLTGVQGRGK
jgi:hypothetical protein